MRTTAPAGESTTVQIGRASWYGPGFHGRETASGERFNQYALTAAHRTLPLGTEATITNVKTGQSVTVTINDRGPHVPGRHLDLSKAAAQRLGLIKPGVGKVKIETRGRGRRRVPHARTMRESAATRQASAWNRSAREATIAGPCGAALTFGSVWKSGRVAETREYHIYQWTNT